VWLGLRYVSVDTDVTLEPPLGQLPNVPPVDYDSRLAALTPSLTLDRRDNFFTPTRGIYVDLSLPTYRESYGSDRDFETVNLTAMYFRPLGEKLYFSVRGSAKDSSDGTPFYLRPYVSLRGVQALQYQGEQAAELEVEIRWQLRPRYSVVGFAGTGEAQSSIDALDGSENAAAGGAGFRYLVARRYGLQMGIDVADGPDDAVLYVVFGNAWLRP
jgi:outer membrane translocation and assembly module TamA